VCTCDKWRQGWYIVSPSFQNFWIHYCRQLHIPCVVNRALSSVSGSDGSVSSVPTTHSLPGSAAIRCISVLQNAVICACNDGQVHRIPFSVRTYLSRWIAVIKMALTFAGWVIWQSVFLFFRTGSLVKGYGYGSGTVGAKFRCQLIIYCRLPAGDRLPGASRWYWTFTNFLSAAD